MKMIRMHTVFKSFNTYKMKVLQPLALLFSILLTFSCSTKHDNITEQEYENAVSYMYANYNNKTAFNLHTTVNWFKDNSGIWYIEYAAGTKVYKTVNFKDYKNKARQNNEVDTFFIHTK